ncbi:MAG: hypothetical protein VKL39_19425, partial [Leptolyngbyaceae bacterium]|nr:hypothetical protein [Leptolyngbyaceae bacterium]
MPHPSAINEDKIVAHAQQGNPDAIATMMNHFFNKKGIQVAVTRKPDALLILVEAAQVPSQEETLPPMQRALKRLGLDHIHEIQVYARQQKALTVAWKNRIDLGKPLTVVDSATQSLQLISWLNQGRKKTVDVATEPLGDAEESIRFLRFYLNEKDTALIALEDIQSIFQVVPQQILRVPNLAEPVLGIYYHRGALVWLVDIGQQLDF